MQRLRSPTAARPKKRPPTTISLFTGAGGLDIGLEIAGFRTTLCVESDLQARETLSLNRCEWRLSEPGDIHALTSAEILQQSGMRPRELTLLAGGPPCQPFSKSGYWAAGDSRRLADPRAATLKAYLDILEGTLPEVFLLENVNGLAFRGKDEGIALIHHRLGQINTKEQTRYNLSLLQLNTVEYGVPQIRERLILVGDRAGRKFFAPPTTHAPPDAAEVRMGKKKRYSTAWDAIGHLAELKARDELALTGKWAGLLPSVPAGENYLFHTPKGKGKAIFGWRRRYWSFLLKLAKARPSWTIQAQPGPATGPFHWLNRRLSIEELCCLQTFPHDYKIAGDYRAAHVQVGNAVPPALGELLGLEIRRQLLGHNVRRRLRLLPEQRDDCSSEEPCVAVPAEFDEYVADHPDHPGPGLGPGAQRTQLKLRDLQATS
jgi:DNA (cytosine-5)-methyltransferase 1